MKGERERKLVLLFRVPFVNEMPLCARFDSLPDSWLKKSRRYPSPQSRDCSEEERKYGRNCTPEVLLLHPKKLFEFRAINLLLFNIVPRLDNDIYICLRKDSLWWERIYRNFLGRRESKRWEEIFKRSKNIFCSAAEKRDWWTLEPGWKLTSSWLKYIYSFVFRVCFEWDDKTIVFCICIDKKNTCLLRRTNRFEITLNHNKISTNMEIFPTFPFRFMERLTVYLFFFIEIRLFDFGVLKCNFL